MILEKTEIATIIKSDEKTFENFFVTFSTKYFNFKTNNVILDLSDNRGIKTEDILLLLKHSEENKNNGTSFVIVIDGINVDELPEELMTVPTLKEAMDIVEMENIERDLGF